MIKTVSNWSNYPSVKTDENSFSTISQFNELMEENSLFSIRGLGRCYGDASLSNHIISTLKFDRIIDFDLERGIFECEPGISLASILEVIVPKGWFLPVTPGTKYITIGGAVASDVHGKNHHSEGSFSAHIIEMDVITSLGKITCNSLINSDLFKASCGGMGLTGLISRVRFKLKKIETAFIRQVQIKAANLDEILDLFEQYRESTYTMAWIDCLKGGDSFGRSILMSGEHALPADLPSIKPSSLLIKPAKLKLAIPFYFPSFALNTLSIKAFNFLYYAKNFKKESNSIVSYDPFFYPLDAITGWNKMYGKKGFVQYQFVLPIENGKAGLVDILAKIRKKGMGSFLAVLKLFGKQESLIAFPMEGYTLALDFPIKKGLFEFLDELDKIVLDYGGRLYMTKDARMKADIFWKSYPHAAEFLQIINQYNPVQQFQSSLSERLLIKNSIETTDLINLYQ